MLMPKKVKYRKQQRGRMKGKAWRGSTLEFGDYGLKPLDAAWITDRQIEAGRISITRYVKRGGKVWIRIFPDKPVTKKPAETRIGKGKGAVEGWVAVGKPGRVLYGRGGRSPGPPSVCGSPAGTSRGSRRWSRRGRRRRAPGRRNRMDERRHRKV